MTWVVIHQMSILHQSVVILVTSISLWFFLRVVPNWGCPSHGEPESFLDDIKWVILNVVVSWVTLFLYNHFYGWHRIADWGSHSKCPSKCPRRNPPDPRDGPMTIRAGEFRGLLDYVKLMEDRVIELEGKRPRSPSPMYSDEVPEDGPSKSSKSPDLESDASARSGSRRVARRLTGRIPPPPPPRSPNDNDVPESQDPPNAQPDPITESERRARNRADYIHSSMNSSSSSKSTSSRSRRSRLRYYGVRGGPFQGVYHSWTEASQALGRGSFCQKFYTFEDALAFSEGDPVRFGRSKFLEDMRRHQYL